MLALTVIPPIVWQYIGVFSTILCGILMVALLWRRREERRMEAMSASNEIAKWGIDPLVKILSAYAVGNYVGKDSVGRGIREVVADIKSGGLETVLRKTGWNVVENVFCKEPEGREKLQKLLDASSKIAETLVK